MSDAEPGKVQYLVPKNHLEEENENVDKCKDPLEEKEKSEIDESTDTVAARKSQPDKNVETEGTVAAEKTQAHKNDKKKDTVAELTSQPDKTVENKKEDAVERLEQGLVSLTLKKKKLLIIPIGGFICDRIRKTPTMPRITRKPDVTAGNFLVYKRPYCDEFLQYCLRNFDVAIWSSALRWNVDGALQCIDKNIDQDDCIETEFCTTQNPRKKIFLRDLSKVWTRKWGEGIKYLSSDILMLEDEPSKCLLNPPNTSIFLTEYQAMKADDSFLGDDACLLDILKEPESPLRTFLDGLIDAPDVPSYVKRNPFGNDGISKGHPDWDYYKKVIERYKPAGSGSS